MATIAINGVELDTDDVKTVRRALAKVRRDEAKAATEQAENRERARLKARDIGFSVLERKAAGKEVNRFWRLYRPGDKHSQCAFLQADDGDKEVTVQCGAQATTVRHYGYDFLGAVTDVRGYVQVIFLQDRDGEREIGCHAIGTADGGAYYLAELPGVGMNDFVAAGD